MAKRSSASRGADGYQRTMCCSQRREEYGPHRGYRQYSARCDACHTLANVYALDRGASMSIGRQALELAGWAYSDESAWRCPECQIK